MFHASLSVPEPQDQMTPLHTNLYLYWGWFLRRGAGYNPTNTEVQYYLQSLYPESRFLDGLPPSLLLCCSSYPYYSARTSGSAQPAYSACVEGRMFHASLSVPEPQDQMTPLHTNLYLYWGWFLRRGAGYNPTNTEVQYYLQSLYPESRFLDGLPPSLLLCCSSYPYYSARTSGSAQPAYSACVEGRMFHASLSVPEPQDQMTPLHTNLYLYWGGS